LETEHLSLAEAKAMSRKLRNAGKTLSNHSISEEVRDRDQFVAKKKTKKERQKEEQAQVFTVKASPQWKETEEDVPSINRSEDLPEVEVLDYDEMVEPTFRTLNCHIVHLAIISRGID
jgi:putative transposase